MIRILAASVAALALLTLGIFYAPPSSAAASVARDLGTDHFAAGGFVRVDQPVRGDLIAAGGSVTVAAPVGGDAIVVGGDVRIDDAVADSVYTAGGRVSLNGRVGRNVRVGGGQVELGPRAAVEGNVTVGGGQVTVKAPVGGYLQAAGGRVLIDAAVGGDVVSTAGSIELGPNARIAGRLRYASREAPLRDPAAQVAGGIEQIALPERRRAEPATVSIARGGRWTWSLGLVLLAAVLAGALPIPAARVRAALRERAALTLLVGFIGLVCIPAAALILMLTVIGIPAALVVATLYLALLLLGYVSTGVTLGTLALERWSAEKGAQTAWRVGAAAAGMLVVTLLARVPVIGGLFVLLAVLAGVGAVLMQAARFRQPPVARDSEGSRA